VISHYIEYGSQILVTTSNFIFILPSRKTTKKGWFVFQVVLASCLVVARFASKKFCSLLDLFLCIFFVSFVCNSILKLVFYTDTIMTEIGPERSSHFFEFTGEMVNSMWAFIFALKVFATLSAAQDRHNTMLAKES
jgi:hypothetical protein